MQHPLPDLPSDARDALAKAALLEDPFSTQALIAAGASPEALDPLFDQGLLEEQDAHRAAFVSEATRVAALRSLSWSNKRRIAQALAESCAALGEADELVGRLYLHAHRYRQARQSLLQAGRKACRDQRFEDGLEHLRAAIEIWPAEEAINERREALQALGRCARNCGDYASLQFALDELLEMAVRSGEPSEIIELTYQLALAAAAAGERGRERALLASAAGQAEQAGLLARSAPLWRRLAQSLGDALRASEALTVLEKAIRAARRVEDWALLSEAQAYGAGLLARLGRLSQARERIEEALNLAIQRDLPELIANAYRRQATVSEYGSQYEAYRDTELAALDRCRALDNREGARTCLSCVAYAYFRLGQFQESLSAIEEAIESLSVQGELLAGAMTVKACILTLRIGGSRSVAALDEANALNRLHNARPFELYILWIQGADATLRGDAALARRCFDELVALWRETDDRKDAVPGFLCAASFFADDNDRLRLNACVDSLNAMHAASESPEPCVAALAASAERDWLLGRHRQALNQMSRAAEGYRSLRLPVEEAWTLTRVGYVASVCGALGVADEAWQQADSIARTLPWKELRRAIARDRSRSASSSSSPGIITPRQRDIARLIAAGHSNKEAAAELGLSPRTVEMHVAALVERLGCRSRAEAAIRANELGLLR